MTDGAALRALIEQEKPHLVVPEIEAIATACWSRSKPKAWPRSSRPHAPPN
jgi:formate-dependent phosphoribosylglycinamide formyltransferase (GAR transformylase)